MQAVDREIARELLEHVGGGQRSWAGVVRDYGLACADGALQATIMSGGTMAPYTLGVGCAAGVAAQGLTDALQAYRGRAR